MGDAPLSKLSTGPSPYLSYSCWSDLCRNCMKPKAGLASLIVERLPEIAENIAKPLAQTDKMVFISQDSATGSKITNDIIKTIATMPDAVEGLTGIDLKDA